MLRERVKDCWTLAHSEIASLVVLIILFGNPIIIKTLDNMYIGRKET